TINPDMHYLKEADRIEIFRGVGDGLRWLRSHGYAIVCVTNQSGVARGLYTDEDVARIHRRVNEILGPLGTAVDAFYYCPHAPETGCRCRKPGTELFERATREWNLDLGASSIIGDRALDVEAGQRLGLLTALVPPRREIETVRRELDAAHVRPDIWASTFPGAAMRILSRG